MIDPVTGTFDHNLSLPFPADYCDACNGLGYHPCDSGCEPECGGNHGCLICQGTGRLQPSIASFDDGGKADDDYDTRREIAGGF